MNILKGRLALALLFFVFSLSGAKAQVFDAGDWDYETGPNTSTDYSNCFSNYCVGDLVRNINTGMSGYIEALYPDQYQALVGSSYSGSQLVYIDELENLSRQNPGPNPIPGGQCAAGFCVGEQVRIIHNNYPYPSSEVGIIIQIHPVRYTATVSFPQSGVREVRFEYLQRAGGGYPIPSPGPQVRCLQGFCNGDLVEWRYAQSYDRAGRIISIQQSTFSAQVRFNSNGQVRIVKLAELRLVSRGAAGGRPIPPPARPGHGRRP